MDHRPPGSAVHGILQARILEWVPFPSPGDFPNPGIKSKSPVSPALQANSLPLSHRESPLFPLQRIESQESLDSFLSFPPDTKIVPENFLLMLLYQHLFHLGHSWRFLRGCLQCHQRCCQQLYQGTCKGACSLKHSGKCRLLRLY